MTDSVCKCVTRLSIDTAVDPVVRYNVTRVNAEFQTVARAIRWHLARYNDWGEMYWYHPAIREEIDYEKFECERSRTYWHWCGDRDYCNAPSFPFGLTGGW